MQSMAWVNVISLMQSSVQLEEQLEEQLVPVEYKFILRTLTVSFYIKDAK